MKNPIAFFATPISTIFKGFDAFFQTISRSEATANLDSTIISPIDFLKSVDLSFGNLIANARDITCVPLTTLTIQLPISQSVLVYQNTNNAVVLDSFQSYLPTQIGSVVNPDGSLVIRIGADLIVGGFESNPVGFYTGSFEHVFAYS